jgi:hypothetical protein
MVIRGPLVHMPAASSRRGRIMLTPALCVPMRLPVVVWVRRPDVTIPSSARSLLSAVRRAAAAARSATIR